MKQQSKALTPELKGQIIEAARMAHALTKDAFADDHEWQVFRERVNAAAQRKAAKEFEA